MQQALGGQPVTPSDKENLIQCIYSFFVFLTVADIKKSYQKKRDVAKLYKHVGLEWSTEQQGNHLALRLFEVFLVQSPVLHISSDE